MSDQAELFDPHQAMRLLTAEESRARRSLGFRENLIYLVWGLCYLLGYLPLALATTPGAPLSVPYQPALTIFSVAIAIGVIASIREAIRASRGVRGANATRGGMYGMAWWVGFLGVGGLSVAVSRADITGDTAGMLVNGASMIVVALLFMAGGAIWLDARQYVMGVWLAVVTALALAIGLPAYYWLMSLLTGGGLLLAPLLHGPIERRRQRRVTP